MMNELTKILIPIYNIETKKVRLLNMLSDVHKQTMRTIFCEQNIESEEEFFEVFKKYPSSVLTQLSEIASNIINKDVINSVIITTTEFDLLRIYVPKTTDDNEDNENVEYEFDEDDFAKRYIVNTEKTMKLYNKVDLLYFYN